MQLALAPVVALTLAMASPAQNPANELADALTRMFMAQRELAAWHAVADADTEALATILADEFQLFNHGTADFGKDDVVTWFEEEPQEVDLSVRVLDYVRAGDTQITSYVLTVIDSEDARELERDLHTSVWVLRDGRWQVIYHEWRPCRRTCPGTSDR